MRILMLALLVALGSAGIAVGCGSDSDTGATGNCPGKGCCIPGDFVFCRCPGGEDGSKECNSAGDGFNGCVAQAGGECPDRGDASGDPTSGDPGPSSTSGDPGGPGGGGVGGSSGAKDFLEPCEQNEECQSGKCPMGYCTKDCAAVEECPVGEAECVLFGSDQVCMAVCGFVGGANDPSPGVNPDPGACKAFGATSGCGYANAVDGWPVLTCADWGPFLQMPLNGTECDSAKWDDLQCNLGHESPGVGRVCAFSACTDGCYEPKDCPSGKSCSSSGMTLGNCN